MIIFTMKKQNYSFYGISFAYLCTFLLDQQQNRKDCNIFAVF